MPDDTSPLPDGAVPGMTTQPFAPDPAARSPQTTPRHDALQLTGGGLTALIRLHEQDYTLRITRQGKLILTK